MSEPQRLEIVFVNPLRIAHEEPSKGRQFLRISVGNFVITTEGDHVMYTLPVGMAVKMQVSYVDAAGNPAMVDGDVTWASSNETIAKVQADDADDTICMVLPQGPIGQVQVVATADADLGEGVRQLMTTADISVVAGEAVAGTISPVGEPTPLQPTPHKR